MRNRSGTRRRLEDSWDRRCKPSRVCSLASSLKGKQNSCAHIEKHCVCEGRGGYLPDTQILVKRRGTFEHAVHGRQSQCIPIVQRLIKSPVGRAQISTPAPLGPAEHLIHVCNSRHVPISNLPSVIHPRLRRVPHPRIHPSLELRTVHRLEYPLHGDGEEQD